MGSFVSKWITTQVYQSISKIVDYFMDLVIQYSIPLQILIGHLKMHDSDMALKQWVGRDSKGSMFH